MKHNVIETIRMEQKESKNDKFAHSVVFDINDCKHRQLLLAFSIEE